MEKQIQETILTMCNNTNKSIIIIHYKLYTGMYDKKVYTITVHSSFNSMRPRIVSILEVAGGGGRPRGGTQYIYRGIK